MSELVLRGVQIAGHRRDVRVVDGAVLEVGTVPPGGAGCETIDGHGGALLPGLYDHHIHIAALAAARRSVMVGPDDVGDAAALAEVLRAAPGCGGWVRAIGYHETVAGRLDRDRLDTFVADRPVRVQHRSGAMWILNSLGCQAVGLAGCDRPGIERDHSGRVTGCVYGLDEWLGARWPAGPLDFASVGRTLAAYGVIGVTDATPATTLDGFTALASAVDRGDLPFHVQVTGGPALAGQRAPAPLGTGPVKIVVADHALPTIDGIGAAIRRAHDAGRAAAIHCVTRVALVLILAAFDDAGPMPGDRIEHGAVVPPELAREMAAMGLTVVTQPNFIRDRGDDYLATVDADDVPHLYPCGSLLQAGVFVGAGTDAPFGDPDPWTAIRAAVDRTTATGAVVGAEEAIAPEAALGLFLTPGHAPGGRPRVVAPGAPADLCLLDRPLADALADPSAAAVRFTIAGGRVTYERSPAAAW